MSILKGRNKGFTLIELLISLAIIGVLAAIILVAVYRAYDETYKARAELELRMLQSAMHVYALDLGHMPPDVDRDLPPGLEHYLPAGNWPEAPWPGTVYDWDHWEPDELNHSPDDDRVIQITIRFCDMGDPIDECNFPQYEWAEDFDVNSGFFYCIEGKCRSHSDEPLDYPGYCVNCPENEAPFGFD
ncbi:MAG: type II secretion system protein [Candidatus Paceibacterota bacterium]